MTADNAVIARLRTWADVAVRHAAEFHGIRLGDTPAAILDADRILRAEQTTEQVATLTACYGAWFGMVVARHLHGCWIGLHDAAAPRVALALAQVSPMDAVERCLTRSDAPTLAQAFAAAQAWSAARADRSAILAHNAVGWDGLADDERFIADQVPPDKQTAESLLDPWLLAEGVAGKRVLCLAAGGGRHGPLLARAGATVTVLDLAPAQLAIDQRLAAAHGLELTTVLGSMDDLPAKFPRAHFAVVVQPVCSSYVADLAPVHAGLAHVLKPGGLLVAQHKQPASLQAHASIGRDGWMLQSFAVDGLPLPAVEDRDHREAGTQEFLHPLSELVGGLCRSGFVIEDLNEPCLGDAWAPRGSGAHRAAFLPPYLKLKARRIG
jgi:SAM-dependent methyltransferase